MKREKVESTGEEIANAVTHVIGSHLGAASTLDCALCLCKLLPGAHWV